MNQIPKYFSAGNLTTYLQCPFKFKLAYIDGLATLYKKHKPYLSAGTTVHKVLSEFFLLEKEKRSIDTMLELLDKHWVSEGYTSKEEETDYKHQVINWLRNFYHNNDIFVIPRYVEEFFRVPIKEFYITGKIDRIDDFEDGVEIIDYKTGGYVPTEEEFKKDLQMNIYAIACFEKYKLFPKKISEIYLQHNYKISATLTQEDLTNTKNNIIEIVEKIYSDKEFKPQKSNLCPYCDFLTVCPEMGMGVKVVQKEKMEQELKEINRQLEKAINDLSLLNSMTLEISSIMDSEKLIDIVTEYISQLGRIKQVAVYMLEQEENIFKLKKSIGCKEPWIKSIEMKTLYTYFGFENAVTSKIIDNQEITTKLKCQKVLFLPMIAKEKILGFVLVAQKTDYSDFSHYDISLLQNLLNHIAVSINNARLYELAITDGLTKLYDQRYFLLQLEQELLRAERYNSVFSLLMIDIDFFKQVNDTYGHLAGDSVLKQLAKILLKSVRETDIVCRYGGEEFSIILISCGKNWAEQIATRIKSNVENAEFDINGKKIKLTVSIGVETFYKGITKQQIISHADKALYKAKLAGRNRVVVYENFIS